MGHRRAHVLGGGSLPVRSPVVPVDCAKFHALWSVCMCERAPERGTRDLLNRTSAMPKSPPKALPRGRVLGPRTLRGCLACSGAGEQKAPKKDRTLAEESEEMRAQSATRCKNKGEP